MDYYYIIADRIIAYTSVTNKHHRVLAPKLMELITITQLN